MRYSVSITRMAEQDLIEAADYIEFVLKNPEAADHLLDLAAEKIGEIADYPAACPIVDDDVLRSWGIRFVTVNNYLAFYTVDEENHVIEIVRFLYAKRDWSTILRQKIMSD